MDITRNTHLYKITCTIKKKKVNIYYRDLTTLEYSFLSNIKNEAVKADFAGKTAIIDYDPEQVPYASRMFIGRDCLERVVSLLSSQQMFEVTVHELREKLKRDDFMMAIKKILTFLPGQSFTELLKLTIIDLLELVCLCEDIYGKPLFDFKTKKRTLVNPAALEDDGKSLQEKMNALNSFIGK